MKTFIHADQIDFQCDQIFQWRPTGQGHYTLRVHHINTPMATDESGPQPMYKALLVQSGIKRMPQVALIPEPERPGQLYTPQVWAELTLPTAWWPLVRPLLAGLGWTSPLYNGLRYRADDLHEIGVFARRMAGATV